MERNVVITVSHRSPSKLFFVFFVGIGIEVDRFEVPKVARLKLPTLEASE
jgi:hypothetical protein|tara:strand:- start:336 stop:485 length:150 start_codon:yes stop_codon:yes gene_type:complete